MGSHIGDSGNTGVSMGDTGYHLHFQIDRHTVMDGNTEVATHDSPYWWGSNDADTPDRYHNVDSNTINPMAFIGTGSFVPVGFALNEDYSGSPHWINGPNGEPDTGLSQKFRIRWDKFLTDQNPDRSLGYPWSNGIGGQAVHQINESMWVQDFYGPHNGLYNPHSSLIMKYNGNVVLLKEGFWDLWMTHFGWLNFGPPVTEEVDYGSGGKQQTCNLNGTLFYMRWVPGDIARIYDQNSNEVNLNQLKFMPGKAFSMILADGSNPASYHLSDFPKMVVDVDGRNSGGSRQELADKSVLDKSEHLKSLQSDGVYHSDIKLAGFNENIPLVNGRTYDGFYVILNGQEYQVSPFTVSGNGTIEVNTSSPMPQIQFGYWNIYPDPGQINQQLHVEGRIYNTGSASVTLSEVRVELLDPNGNEVYHYSEYNVNMQPGYYWYQWISVYPYMPGNHTARFRGLVAGQWTTFATRTVYVEGTPLVTEFNTNARLGYAPLAVQFTDQSTGNPTSWSWNFGDGNSSDSRNPSHTYNSAGIYTVSLTTSNTYSSDVETKSNYITVNAGLHAGFTSNVTSGLLPLAVQFTDQSTGTPTSWLWNFGDGATSIAQSPVHTYTANGIYNVVLTVSDQVGSNTMTKSGYIVTSNLHADFSANHTSIGAGELVQFTDLSTGSPTSWTWNFGDGAVYQHNGALNHTYMNPGVYTVTLTVSNSLGTDVETKTNYIAVGPTVLSFTADVHSGRVPLTVHFIGSAPGTPAQWCWNFGDGTITGITEGTTCAQYQTHVYQTPGVYNVELAVVYGGIEGILVVYNNFITVAGSFAANVTEGLNPLAVQFTDQSGVSASTWSWNFGDGGTSTAHNPAHIYNTPGTYTVTLVAGSGPEAVTMIRQSYIRVVNTTMGFVANVTYGSAPLTVHFTNNSLGNPIAWFWDFGDGGMSVDKHTTHIYTNTGVYSVMLLAMYGSHTDTLRCNNYIHVVNQSLVSVFFANTTSGVAPLTVQFTDQSTGGPTSWSWDFGDSNTSTLQNPTHIYSSVRSYTVSLTVGNAGHFSLSTQNNYIVVHPAIRAGFISNVTQGLVPLNVQFTDQSLGSPTSWLWDFGDGNTATTQNPTHTYNSVGTYNVSLIASNAFSSDSISKGEYIHVRSLSADYISNVTSGFVPLTVQFTDQSTGSPTSRLWNFGDGAISTLQNPTHTYTVLGSYSVSLTVSNEAGSNCKSRSNYILVVDGLHAEFATNTSYGVAPLAIHFTDRSLGSPTSWLWDFGDGNTVTTQNPTHTYNSVGTYNVSLRVVAGADSSSVVREGCVVTLGAMSAYFAAADTLGAAPFTVQFSDQSSGNPTSWLWNFGDGVTSTAQNPSHTYTSVGTYDVSQLVVGASGSNALTVQHYIRTVAPVIANFVGSPTNVRTNTPVQFSDQSTGTPTSWLWNFGDGVTVTQQNPAHTYTVHGIYTVSLTVSNGLSVSNLVRTNYIVASKPQRDDDLYPYCEPNPSNPMSLIKFRVDQPGYVRLDIFDVKGRRVATLVDQSLPTGIHETTFDGSQLSSGTYFYRISSADGVETRKITLVR
jgi:PKD repeat protein